MEESGREGNAERGRRCRGISGREEKLTIFYMFMHAYMWVCVYVFFDMIIARNACYVST